MTESPRFIRRVTSAALPAVLAMGSFLSDAPKPFAAPQSTPTATQTQMQTVTEQQAYSLFDSLLRDRVFRNIDIETNLLNRYQNAQNDSEWALIAGASEMGIVNQVNNAVNEALNRAVDDRLDGITLVKGRYEESRDKYANWHYKDSKMTFVQVVAKDANKFLPAAQKHQMSVPNYLAKIYIPANPNDPDIRNLAKFNATNNSIPMVTVPKP